MTQIRFLKTHSSCGPYNCNCTNTCFNKVLGESTNDYIELRLCDFLDLETLHLFNTKFMSNEMEA